MNQNIFTFLYRYMEAHSREKKFVVCTTALSARVVRLVYSDISVGKFFNR